MTRQSYIFQIIGNVGPPATFTENTLVEESMKEHVAEAVDPGSLPERRLTILLLDDHPSIRLILTAGFKAHGFDVLTAATAEKAMALCEAFEGPIDILLADVGLTPQDLWSAAGSDDSIPHGVALAGRAIQLRPTLKVVLFTGYSDERLQRLGADLNGYTLLRKPCGLATLITTFRQMLHAPSPSPSRVPRVDTTCFGEVL